ncbi:MAG: beta-lactamase family protein [Gemmatimonadaceae bacterium]|nr:beta-lactamase family protein [Gemmatimonadaceae bacterium]
MTRSPLLALIVTILALAPASPAQSAATASIDRYVAGELARQHIPGMAVAIYKGGRIVFAKGYGLANVELDVPVQPATIFQSGSVGKQFTATAVMMLVEDGKIALTDSLPKYFPDAPASWRGITVRHLLNHTSGLTDYTSDSVTKPGGQISYRLDYTEAQLVSIIETLPIEFPPGEKWEYCNTNYVLLGAIIRKASGEFYGDFLQERVFGPLGMAHTRIISERDIIANRASGYELVGGSLVNQEWVSPSLNTTADGALYFNVLDLAKWDAALYGEKILHKSSLDQMWTIATLNDGNPNSSNYGFAWFVDSVNGHRVMEHSGSWQGFEAYIARYVDDGIAVVTLMNLGGVDPKPIAHSIAGLYSRALMAPADSSKH